MSILSFYKPTEELLNLSKKEHCVLDSSNKNNMLKWTMLILHIRKFYTYSQLKFNGLFFSFNKGPKLIPMESMKVYFFHPQSCCNITLYKYYVCKIKLSYQFMHCVIAVYTLVNIRYILSFSSYMSKTNNLIKVNSHISIILVCKM